METKIYFILLLCIFQDQKANLITIKPKAVEIKFGSETVTRCDLKKRGDELSEWDVKKINTLYDCPKDKYPHIETIGNKGISIVPLHSDEITPPIQKPKSNQIKVKKSQSRMISKSRKNPPPKDMPLLKGSERRTSPFRMKIKEYIYKMQHLYVPLDTQLTAEELQTKATAREQFELVLFSQYPNEIRDKNYNSF